MPTQPQPTSPSIRPPVHVASTPTAFPAEQLRKPEIDMAVIEFVMSESPARSSWYEISKRTMDICVSALALLVLSPVFLLTALLVRLYDLAPSLYAQTRVGRGGKLFKCYKFRTMVIDADEMKQSLANHNHHKHGVTFKMPQDPRRTRLGRILRKTSIDELPQFWNVLKGDMSIVGPRPIIDEEAERYGPFFADYCAVRPGITGAWQVGGRNLTSYDHRVALDVDYVRNATLFDDLRIVLRTVAVVLTQKGAS